jgi:hypothetical protein
MSIILFILIYTGGSDVYLPSQRAQFCEDSLIRTNPKMYKLTKTPGNSSVRLVTCTAVPETSTVVVTPADWVVQ